MGLGNNFLEDELPSHYYNSRKHDNFNAHEKDFDDQYEDATESSQSMPEREEVDEYGRVTKGPYTLKNGATYTEQWLDGMRDGYGT